MLSSSTGKRGGPLLSRPALLRDWPSDIPSVAAQMEAVEAFLRSHGRNPPRGWTRSLRSEATGPRQQQEGWAPGGKERCGVGAVGAEKLVSPTPWVSESCGEAKECIEQTALGKEEEAEVCGRAKEGEGQSEKEVRDCRFAPDAHEERAAEILQTLLFSVATGHLRVLDWDPLPRWKLVESLFVPLKALGDTGGEEEEKAAVEDLLRSDGDIGEADIGKGGLESVEVTKQGRLSVRLKEKAEDAEDSRSSGLSEGGRGRSEETLVPGFSSRTIFKAFYNFLNQWLLFAEDALSVAASPAFCAPQGREGERGNLDQEDAAWPPSWRQWAFIIRLLERFFQRRYLRPLFLSLKSGDASPSASGSERSSRVASQRASLEHGNLDLAVKHLLAFPALLEESVSCLPGGPVASRTLIPTSLSFRHLEHEAAACLFYLWCCKTTLRTKKEAKKEGGDETREPRDVLTESREPDTFLPRGARSGKEESRGKKDHHTTDDDDKGQEVYEEGQRRRGEGDEEFLVDGLDETPGTRLPSSEEMGEATRRFVMRGHASALARVVVLFLLSSSPSSRSVKKKASGETGHAGSDFLLAVRCLVEGLRRVDLRGGLTVLTFLGAALKELSPFFFLSSKASLGSSVDSATRPAFSGEPADAEHPSSSRSSSSHLHCWTNCLSVHSLGALRLLRALLLACIPAPDKGGDPHPFSVAAGTSAQVSLPQIDELFQLLLRVADPRSARCLPLPSALAVIDLLAGDEILAWLPIPGRSAGLSRPSRDEDWVGRSGERPEALEGQLKEALPAEGKDEGLLFLSSPADGFALILAFIDFLDHLLQLWETPEILREVSLHQHIALTAMLLRCLGGMRRLEDRILRNRSGEEPRPGHNSRTRTCTGGQAGCPPTDGGCCESERKERLVFSKLTPAMMETVRRRFAFGTGREHRVRRLMEGVHLRLGSAEEVVRCCGMAIAEELASLLVASLRGEDLPKNERPSVSPSAFDSADASSVRGEGRGRERAPVDGLRFRELRDAQLAERHPVLVKYLRAVECEGWTVAPRLGLQSVDWETKTKARWENYLRNTRNDVSVAGETKEGALKRADHPDLRPDQSVEGEREVEEPLVVPESQDDLGQVAQLLHFLNPPTAVQGWDDADMAVSATRGAPARPDVETGSGKPLGDERELDAKPCSAKQASFVKQPSAEGGRDLFPGGGHTPSSRSASGSSDVQQGKRSIRVAVSADDEDESSDEDNAYFESLPDLAPMQPVSGSCREEAQGTPPQQLGERRDALLVSSGGPGPEVALPSLLPQPPPGAPGLPQSVRQVTEWLTGSMHVVDESPDTYGQLDPASSSARGSAAGGNEAPAHRAFRISAALHTCAPLTLLQFCSAMKTGGRSRPAVCSPSECPGEFSDPYLGPRLLRALVATETAHGAGLETLRRAGLAALLAVQLTRLLPLLCEILTSTDYVVGQRLVLLESLQKAMAWLANGAPRDWSCLRGVEEDEGLEAETDEEETVDSAVRGKGLSPGKEDPNKQESFRGFRSGQANSGKLLGARQGMGSANGTGAPRQTEEEEATGPTTPGATADSARWHKQEENGFRWREGRTRRFAHPTPPVRTTPNYLVPHAERICVELFAVLEIPCFPASADFLTQQRHRQRLAAHKQALSQPVLMASILHTVGVCIQNAGQGILNAAEVYGHAVRAAHRFKGHADRHVRRAALGLLAAVGAVPGASVGSLVSWIEDAEVGCIYTPGWELECAGEGGLPGIRTTPGAGVFLPERQKYAVGVSRGGAAAIVQWLQAQAQSDPDEVSRQLAGLVLSTWLELPSS